MIQLKFFIVLTMFATSITCFAGESLLKAGIEDVEKGWAAYAKERSANINLMSEEGRSEFQKMRDLGVITNAKDSRFVVSHNGGDRELSVLLPTKKSGEYGGVVNQVMVSESGEVTRLAYKVPETPQEPRIQLKDGHGSGKGPEVIITRSWNTPVGESLLKQSFVPLEIDGKVYRMQTSYELKKRGYSVKVTASAPPYQDGRFTELLLNFSDPSSTKFYKASGFRLGRPDIKGDIIGYQVNSDVSRLTFQTSGGEEYTYKLETDKFNAMKATKTGFKKIDLKDFLVESKVFKGRIEAAAGESAHGLSVDSPVAK